jgi:hypothetical protein
LQGQLTRFNEEVERLTNENRQLTGSLATQNEQSLRDAQIDSDRQLNLHRKTVTDFEAEIERLTGLIINFEYI